MSFIKRKEVILLLRLVIGGVFVYASFDKILHSHEFAISVRAYKIIPIALSNLFALSVAWAELIAGTMLIIGLFTRKASAAIGILLVMFVFAISIVLVKGLVIDCGCFKSDGGTMVGPMLLLRNLLMLIGVILIMRFDTGFFALTRPPQPGKI
jgi:uncharacterized membrane protein YphA (DoxX/SURF4 family)